VLIGPGAPGQAPTACDAGKAAAYPPFQAQEIWLRNDDMLAVASAVRERAGSGDMIVDLQGIFGRPPDPGMLQADGLHPSLLGQQAIARAFVEQVAASSTAP
jgi:acyl-CoA thioesterase I